MGEGGLFEAHHCAQKISIIIIIIIIIMFLELFVLLRFSFSSFLPFFFLCSNFFGHLLHWPSQLTSWLCRPVTATLWSCDPNSVHYNTPLLLQNVLSLCRPSVICIMPSSAWMLSFYRTTDNPHKLCCSLNEDWHSFYEFCLLKSGSQLHGLIFPLLPEVQQKLRMQILHNGLPEILCWLLFTYLHTPLGADGWSQWAVIAAHP